MCGGSNDDDKQYDKSELPDDWRANIKNKDYKADDYKVNKSYKSKNLVDQNRKCTDVLCCLLFLVFSAFCGGLVVYGYKNGEVAALLAPVDGNGRLCGISKGVEGYSNLWIADFEGASNNPNAMFQFGVCVKKCPKGADESVDCVNTRAVKDCEAKSKSYGTLDTVTYCVPILSKLSDNQKAGYDAMIKKMGSSFSGGWAVDIYKARMVIISSVGICVVLTILYVMAMRCCASILAWISVALVQFGLIALGFFFFYQRKDLAEGESSTSLWWAMVISWILAIFFYLFLACNWKSLQVSIAVIKTTSDWVADTKRLLLMPLLFFIVGMVIFFFWALGLAAIASMSEKPIEQGDNPGSGEQTKTVKWSDQTYWMIYTMIFYGVWVACFLISFNDYVTIVAAISWYFSDKHLDDSDGIPGDSEVLLGFKWGLCYQLGSLAFGSLIIAIVTIVHAIMTYIAKKMEQASGENCAVKCLIGCIMCCVNCFDRFIRFITQNAYIYMALSNESFCTSAIHAFLLILRNTAKFSMVSGIATVFMFIAKVCISVSTTWIGFILMGEMIPKGESFQQPLVPVALIFLVAYLISSIFIGVFDAGANTILQCYLWDKEMGGTDDEKHVPESLKSFLPDSSVKEQEMAATPTNQEGSNAMV